ncbi:unnamed protein product [Eruca vesicaria subsp. sativa]|uniref:Uncharacterized protein n=1 Tax=Eruca vesicaria subsp. sativa TaxID=29727 RepID=A0ABC8IU35_ERUVS|nr:unnamed protein product [Eruca vesicaria subsp. sativa]
MSSRKKVSRKSTPRSSTSEDVCDDDLLVPKAEFEPQSISPAENEAYWIARCGLITRPPEVPYLNKLHQVVDHNLLNRSTHSILKPKKHDSDSDASVPLVTPRKGKAKQSKDKAIDLEDFDFSADDFVLPGWGPSIPYGDGSGASEAPFPNVDFDELLASLPTNFDLAPPVYIPEISEVVAEGSRLITGILTMTFLLGSEHDQLCL